MTSLIAQYQLATQSLIQLSVLTNNSSSGTLVRKVIRDYKSPFTQVSDLFLPTRMVQLRRARLLCRYLEYAQLSPQNERLHRDNLPLLIGVPYDTPALDVILTMVRRRDQVQFYYTKRNIWRSMDAFVRTYYKCYATDWVCTLASIDRGRQATRREDR